MDNEVEYKELCREIYNYYSSKAIPAKGNRTALMLRATGEPWNKQEIEQYTSCRNPDMKFDDFWKIAKAKRFGIGHNTRNPADYQHLVDEYGTWINLSVNECMEIVTAFKAIVQLRGAVDNSMAPSTINTQYLMHLLTHVGDPIPRHTVKYLKMDQHGYNGRVSIRTMLKMLGRKE
ncbi:uncharacterized protein BBOV_IV010850 [Babesia bovis T2Bo]|uniref:Uncharacterized protein n=1 Tax=Babesia bovis TaxID=5865 RepID=A7ASB9_BABBO|nr:uncharacterized protein BBOV_IV010850 [Babesia bovis T2Bo]EDO07438.1 hypothetical protein BBOV_IV010850 [Babesia bovis T2Bo]|eukprot:XP_001611006.1 hypothetical protein [Babesia bovis T2Bo]